MKAKVNVEEEWLSWGDLGARTDQDSSLKLSVSGPMLLADQCCLEIQIHYGMKFESESGGKLISV